MKFPLIDDDNIIDEFSSEFEINPFEVEAKVKLEKMTEIMNKGLSKSDKFLDFRVSFEEVKISKIFLSSNKDLEQSILYTNMHLVAIGRSDKGVKYDFFGLSDLKGYELRKKDLLKFKT